MTPNTRRAWAILVVVLTLMTLIISCAKKTNVKTPTYSIRQHEQIIANVNRLATQDHFDEAISSCKEFLQQYPQSPVLDHALFQCGLVYASEQNPQKNYDQAVTLLNRIPAEVPMSAYATNAGVIAHLVNMLSQLRNANAKQTEMIEALQTTEAQLKETLSQVRSSYDKQKEAAGALQSSDTRQRQTIRELQATQAQQALIIKELQSEIEKLKRIDLRKRP
ncbi:MAG: outer membrane protein assembly factor BamD [Acidobacteriia bacterium]|nr:outer membrane protein assembly factor BamD [Terriglobia bacterium]